MSLPQSAYMPAERGHSCEGAVGSNETLACAQINLGTEALLKSRPSTDPVGTEPAGLPPNAGSAAQGRWRRSSRYSFWGGEYDLLRLLFLLGQQFGDHVFQALLLRH